MENPLIAEVLTSNKSTMEQLAWKADSTEIQIQTCNVSIHSSYGIFNFLQKLVFHRKSQFSKKIILNIQKYSFHMQKISFFI